MRPRRSWLYPDDVDAAVADLRAAGVRVVGRLKHDYALAPLRVRGWARVQLHTDVTMLARLAHRALVRARAVPLAA